MNSTVVVVVAWLYDIHLRINSNPDNCNRDFSCSILFIVCFSLLTNLLFCSVGFPVPVPYPSTLHNDPRVLPEAVANLRATHCSPVFYLLDNGKKREPCRAPWCLDQRPPGGVGLWGEDVRGREGWMQGGKGGLGGLDAGREGGGGAGASLHASTRRGLSPLSLSQIGRASGR